MTEVPAGHPEKPQGEDGRKLVERMNGGHHEELSLWGLSFLDLPANGTGLDVGCGGGANIARLLERMPQGSVAGADYSPVSVQASTEHNAQAIAEGRCRVVHAEAAALPFPDASFDVVTAFETVYYWDLAASFAEVLRVLKPGGRFLICNEDDGLDPGALEFAKKVPGMTMHTCAQLCEVLTQAGFAIESSNDIPETGHMAIVACKAKA